MRTATKERYEMDVKTIVTPDRLINVVKLPNGRTQLLFFKRNSVKVANPFIAAGNVVLDKYSLAELAKAISDG